MTGQERWARLDDLLDGALDQPPERRRAWLAEACAGDPGLRSRALSLLDLAERDDGDLVPGGGLRGPVWDDVATALERRDAAGLRPGDRLGPYEILELLGAGGMGRVYRARDVDRNRDVALKALSPELAADPTNLRRFEREAKLLSRLSHESVARLHGFQVLNGHAVLVLELAEGETLSETLTRGALTPAQAISVARQVAGALAEAHEKGIVHRDLKPSNVKLSPDGRVKVLDFGLARRLRGPGQATGSISGTLTHEGMVLGTIPYMSPEQARGERVDQRTDVWALGCLLYEMLTGLRAVRSRTVADLLESVLKEDVDLGALPPATPPGLRRVVRRCLRRDPASRYQDVRDARLDLEELETAAGATGAHAAAVPRVRGSALLPWTVAALAIVATLTTLFLAPGRGVPRAGGSVRQFVLDMPPGVSLPRDGSASPVALSPDGSIVVLAGEEDGARRLYVRHLAHLAWTVLLGTEGARQPFLSPEGDAAGFFTEGRLVQVPLDGGQPADVAAVDGDPEGAAWAPDGTIVFGSASSSGLLRVDARGGTPQPLTELAEDEGSHRWPGLLPDGRTVIFTVEYREAGVDEAGIEIVSLETGRRQPLLRGGAHAVFAPGGHVVYARRGSLFSAPFDVHRLQVTGAAARVLDGVAYDPRDGATKAALAGDGTLAYVPASPPAGAATLVLAQGWAWSLLRRDGAGGP